MGYSGAQWTMLLGEHDHSLDDKNRLTLPAKLREHFGDGVVVTRGLDGCLYAYAHAEWERHWPGGSGELDPLSRESRADAPPLLRRRGHGRARQAGPDRAADALLEDAGIEREVTVAGVYDHLEIWDRAKWRDQLHEVEGSAEDVAERLAN